MANQSQIEQLFDVYEHGESGEDLEEDDSAQGGSQTEAEKFEGNSSPLTDEPSSYTREICKEQTDELFELCEEIQNIVGQVQQDSLINLSATYTDISSLNTGNSLATENPLESIDNSLTVTNDSLASIENSLTNTDNSLTDNSLTDIDNSLTDIDNSLTDTDNSLINIIDNSLTITDNSNDPHVIGGIVERIYIDVEEESTVHAIGTSGGKESAETLPVSICNEMNLFGGETDDVTSHEYGKTSDLIAAEDLLNEFDYILNSYGTSNVLKDNTITSSSPGDNLGVGEEWDDLLSDLFPSLSSL